MHLLANTDKAINGEVDCHPCTGNSHKVSSDMFDRLDDDVKAAYRDAAESSNTLAYNVLLQPQPSAELVDDPMEVDIGTIVPADKIPHPCPAFAPLVATTTGNGDDFDALNSQLYPISKGRLVASTVSLKTLARTWKERTRKVQAPELKLTSAYKKGCLECGACQIEWERRRWPWWKRSKWLDLMHKFVKGIPTPIFWRHLPRPKTLELLVFEGFRGAHCGKRVFYMLGHYLSTPVMYTMVEYVEFESAKTAYPYMLLPNQKPAIQTKRDVSGLLQSNCGALSWERHVDVATSLLSNPDIAIMDERCEWFVSQGMYSWYCLVDSSVPLAQIQVSGTKGLKQRIDGPKPRVRATGAAAAKAKAHPKPKAKVHPKPKAASGPPLGLGPPPLPPPFSPPPLPPLALPAPAGAPVSFDPSDLIGDDDMNDHCDLVSPVAHTPAPCPPSASPAAPTAAPCPPSVCPPSAAAPCPPSASPAVPAAAPCPPSVPSMADLIGDEDMDDHMDIPCHVTHHSPASIPPAPAAPLEPSLDAADGDTDTEWVPDDDHVGAGFDDKEGDELDAAAAIVKTELDSAHAMVEAAKAEPAEAPIAVAEQLRPPLPTETVTLWLKQKRGASQPVLCFTFWDRMSA